MAGPANGATWNMAVANAVETERLAASLSPLLRIGDFIALDGGLGAGKTAFARALIRSLTNTPDLEVPSPTFTLMQTYDGPIPIVHADLYRVGGIHELEGLGWEEAGDGALMLVEWPDRAAPLPADRIHVRIAFGANDEAREITITGYGMAAARIRLASAIERVIAAAGFTGAERHYLQGDASSRAYERLVGKDGRKAILMIAPKRPDGPIVRNGKPYSQIAHLAEDVRPFVALADGLRARGFSAPQIYGSDLDAGLLVLEDLGVDGVIFDGVPSLERYIESVAVLAALHHMQLPTSLPVKGSAEHIIPRYDLEALGMETELLLDWYLPHRGRSALPATARQAFVDAWRRVLTPVLGRRQTWTLRDFHSPNLIWMPERDGVARIGLLDFQDCVLGPAAYDVVSLSQDARIDVPDDVELQILGAYVRLRRVADPSFDAAQFAAEYAIMGAQRATKILGIFARLNARDGKPAYLRHLPRIERNVRRCLLHPALAELKGWYQTHLPDLFA